MGRADVLGHDVGDFLVFAFKNKFNSYKLDSYYDDDTMITSCHPSTLWIYCLSYLSEAYRFDSIHILKSFQNQR